MMTSLPQRVLLVALACAQPTLGESVWWRYYDDGTKNCEGGNGLEWVPVWSEKCLFTESLREADPFRKVAVHLLGKEGYLTWSCAEQNILMTVGEGNDCTGGVTVVMKEGVCGAGGGDIMVGNKTDVVVEEMLGNIKVSCTSCNWVFFEEDPPPYTILATGIMIFLVVCLFVNVFLKSHLDRMIRDRHQYFPAFFTAPPVTPYSIDIKPGCTVWVNTNDQRAVVKQTAAWKARQSQRRPSSATSRRPSARRQSVGCDVTLEAYDVVNALEGAVVPSSSFRKKRRQTWAVDIESSTSPTYDFRRGSARGCSFDAVSIPPPRARQVSEDNEVELSEILTALDDSVVEDYLVHCAAERLDDDDSVVEDYLVHCAAKTPRHLTKQSIEPLLPDPDLLSVDGTTPTSSSHYSPGVYGGLKEFKFPVGKRRAPPVVNFVEVRFCVVCNEMETAGNKLEKREHGWKCIGDKRRTCIGKRPNMRLVFMCSKEIGDDDTQTWASDGQLGPSGVVVGMRVGDDAAQSREALVRFKKPTAWVSVNFARNIASDIEVDSLEEDENGKAAIYVGVEKEAMWRKLVTHHGCELLARDQTGMWVAIKLLEDTSVWLPMANISKVGDFHGSYIRVGDVEDIRNAAFANWQEWWRDFALCVGKIADIKPRGTEMRFHVTIDFGGDAVITLPADTLRHAEEAEYDKEFLLVPQPVHIRTMTAVFIVHPLLLAGKALFLVGYFGFAVVQAASEGHAGYAGKHTKWQIYQEVYFKLFNSGYPTLMADFGAVIMYRVLFTSQGQASMVSVAKTLGIPVLCTLMLATSISLPGFFTHVVPMLVLYGWLWVPFIVIMALVVRFIRKIQPKPPDVGKEHLFDGAYYFEHHKSFIIQSAAFHMFYRFCTELAAVICLQTNYNFAIILYGGLAGYLETIFLEYDLRSIGCIIEEAAKMATLLW